MGVIDLDKRVKKLEQDGAGGAELDQLEAAVTAIENELTVTVTDISGDLETLPEGVTADFAYFETYGKVCSVTFGLDNGGSSVSGLQVYKIPADKIPYTPYSYTASVNDAYILEGEDGYYIACELASGLIASVQWIANPAPTPGE